ncbi:MAG: hypothetical protein V3V85_02445 [Candidatus Thorarchaeota archaeon]
MKNWIAGIMVLTLCGAAMGAELDVVPDDRLVVSVLGSEDQLGGTIGLAGKYTTFGFDGRYLKHYGPEEESTNVLSVFASWNAVPKLTIPVGGFFPQFNVPGPESIDIQINLIARLGYETEYEDIVATLGVEAELLTTERTTLALRYEYAFDNDFWDQLATDMVVDQHQAMLNLKYRFK